MSDRSLYVEANRTCRQCGVRIPPSFQPLCWACEARRDPARAALPVEPREGPSGPGSGLRRLPPWTGEAWDYMLNWTQT